jgi:hypothetical protein
VQSHSIPRAFFGADGDSKLISNTEGQYPRRMPIGVYDRIVCDDCEKRFGPYDNYAAKTLVHNFNRYIRVPHNGQSAAVVVPKPDYHRLKLFAISLLWRAAVSSHVFYRKVKIGPFEKRAREMILADDPGDADDFATWWSTFDIPDSPGIMDPFKEKWGGVTAYRFYLGRVLAYIKVDQRPMPKAFVPIALIPGKDLIMVIRDFSESPDVSAMRVLAKNATRGKAGLWPKEKEK